MLTIFSALAELEREQTLQHQKEGITIARSRGKYKGRQRIRIDEDLFRTYYAEWKSGKITATCFRNKIGLKPVSFYRRIKRYEETREIN